MKPVYVNPRKIMVPGNLGIARYELLRGYYCALHDSRKNCLPPVVLMPSSVAGAVWDSYIRHQSCMPFTHRDSEREKRVDELLALNCYFLFDGTHRSIATTLCNRKIKAYLLDGTWDEVNRNLRELRYESVRLSPKLSDEAGRINDLVISWFDFVRSQRPWNLEEGVNTLIDTGEMPYDMERCYTRPIWWVNEDYRRRAKRITLFCSEGEGGTNETYKTRVRADTTIELICHHLNLERIARGVELIHGWDKVDHYYLNVSSGNIYPGDSFRVHLLKDQVEQRL